ncbi:MAG: type II toxin-antitoxin system VapC family toxin, partial [Myxococcota bacterium]
AAPRIDGRGRRDDERDSKASFSKGGTGPLRYLLDTNTVSALMKGEPSVATRLAETAREDVGISQITVAEIEFGLVYLPQSKRRAQLRRQWAVIGSELTRLTWDDRVSRTFGLHKARLERAGNRISDFDLAVAAHAIAFDLVVVTADRAFERIPVRRENWLG